MPSRRTRPVTWRSRIAVRLLAFNLLLVFLPVAGILYLDVYETRLLDAQERSMVQQARLLAAALAEHETIDPAGAGELLSRMGRADARLRVYGTGATLLADSNRIRFADEPAAASPYGAGSSVPASQSVRVRVLYRIGASIVAIRRGLVSLSARFFVPRQRAPGSAKVDGGPH